jgi:hypothetical protein
MVFADLLLHLAVSRHNTNSGVKYAGETGFGTKSVHVYNDDVIEDLYQVRGAAHKGYFPPDSCDEYHSPTIDTKERFGLGWGFKKYWSVMDGEGTALEKMNELQHRKPFQFQLQL